MQAKENTQSPVNMNLHFQLWNDRLQKLAKSILDKPENLDADEIDHLSKWIQGLNAFNLLQFISVNEIYAYDRDNFDRIWQESNKRMTGDDKAGPEYFESPLRFTSERVSPEGEITNTTKEKPLVNLTDLQSFLTDYDSAFFFLACFYPPDEGDSDWLRPLVQSFIRDEAIKQREKRKEWEAKIKKQSPAEIKRADVRLTQAAGGLVRYPINGLGILPELIASARMADNGLLSFESNDENTLLLIPGTKLGFQPNKENQTSLIFKDLDKAEHLNATKQTSMFKDIIQVGLKGLNSSYVVDSYVMTLLELLVRVDSGKIESHNTLTPILWKELAERMNLGDLGKDGILERRRAASRLFSFIRNNPVTFRSIVNGKPHIVEVPIFTLGAQIAEEKDGLFSGVEAAIGPTMARGLFGIDAPKKTLECSLLDANAITNTPYNKGGRSNELRLTYQLLKTAIDGRTYGTLHGKNKTDGRIILSEADIAREILPQPTKTGAAQRVARGRQREALQNVCNAMVKAGTVKTAIYSEGDGITAEPCKRMIDACDQLSNVHKTARQEKEAARKKEKGKSRG